MPTHYETLQVPKTASETEIRKAYLKLSLRWHPDKNQSKEAETKFKEISTAYQVLSDPSLKRDYDQSLNNPFTSFTSFNSSSSSYTTNFTPQDIDPQKIFQQFMDEMFKRTGSREPQEIYNQLTKDPKTKQMAQTAAGGAATVFAAQDLVSGVRGGSLFQTVAGVAGVLGGLWVASGTAPDEVSQFCGAEVANRIQNFR